MLKATVITVSDRAYNGVYKDLTGPEIVKELSLMFDAIEIQSVIVADEESSLMGEFTKASGGNIIITTGGTGFSLRDITPEVTQKFCDRMAPGIAEFLRLRSLQETDNAALSRATAGLKGSCLVINLPGSVKAVKFCMQQLSSILPHAMGMINGKGH